MKKNRRMSILVLLIYIITLIIPSNITNAVDISDDAKNYVEVIRCKTV